MKHKGKHSRKRKSGPKEHITEIKGKYMAQVTATSAAAAYVNQDYDLKTSLMTMWGYMANYFEFWRIKYLTVQLFPNAGFTTNGQWAIGFIEDPDSGTITTLEDVAGLRVSRMDSIFKRIHVTYRPKVILKWLLCNDPAATEDRLEFAGRLVIATQYCATSFNPGRYLLTWQVDFKGFKPSTITKEITMVEWKPKEEILQKPKAENWEEEERKKIEEETQMLMNKLQTLVKYVKEAKPLTQ